MERSTFGSSLSITDQIYLNRAINAIDEEEARAYLAKAKLPCAYLEGNDFTAVLHTARLNNVHAAPNLRAASSQWLAAHGYPAPVINP